MTIDMPYGQEVPLTHATEALRDNARRSGATAFGAFQITCSDESEHEVRDVLRSELARRLLPELKYGSHVPFRIENPGARYELGSAAIAIEHFVTAAAEAGGLWFVVKINSHCAVGEADATTSANSDGVSARTYGSGPRYGERSTYCGAVAALLQGASLPFLDDMADHLGAETTRALRDPARVPPAHAPLFGAIASAAAQARRVADDIEQGSYPVPLLVQILHATTLNRPGPDAELLGGCITLDLRPGAAVPRAQVGLGGDPTRYRLGADPRVVLVHE